jgi:protein-S-isoprenylcysteine O-methyltransferase Ste14
MVIGVILVFVSLFADPLALGLPNSGFGWKQVVGTLLGLSAAFIGIWGWRRFET